MNERVRVYGDPEAEKVVIQLCGEHEQDGIDRELAAIQAQTEETFCLITYGIREWNRELSPWPAPPVFGNEAFGDGAAETLTALETQIFSVYQGKKLYLAGYSLAGLFALWAAWQGRTFEGVAGVSPSVWFPGWLELAESQPPRAKCVYLSLGDKEEKTRHPVMKEVGNCIRKQDQLLTAQSIAHTLEWNPGNHFREPEIRLAKGIAWMLRE